MPPSPLQRRLLDAGALATALLGVWLALGPSRPVLPEPPGWWWVDLAGGLLGSAALCARRRAPVMVALAVALLGIPVTTVWLAGAVATFGVAARRPWPLALLLGVFSLITGSVQDLVRAMNAEATSWGTLGYAVAITAAVLAWGAALRQHHQLLASLVERAERAERETTLRDEAARAAERTRIAREMHDVLAHRLSLVSMHAAALLHRREAPGPTAIGPAELDPAELDAALEVIRRGAQQALHDLRVILGVLREPTSPVDTPTRAPQPTLAELDRLLDDVRATGTTVHLRDELDGGRRAVPADCARTLYRVVQEGLTNATRHAPGQPVDVAMRGGPDDDVELEIRNPLPYLPAQSKEPGSGGTGLLGIAERVELAGGRITARGPDDGCFRVAVRVPWPAAGAVEEALR